MQQQIFYVLELRKYECHFMM